MNGAFDFTARLTRKSVWVCIIIIVACFVWHLLILYSSSSESDVWHSSSLYRVIQFTIFSYASVNVLLSRT